MKKCGKAVFGREGRGGESKQNLCHFQQRCNTLLLISPFTQKRGAKAQPRQQHSFLVDCIIPLGVCGKLICFLLFLVFN